MDVIKPITFAASMLTSSTILEPDTATGEVAWSSTEPTIGGDVRAYATSHKLYQRVGSGLRKVVTITSSAFYWPSHGLAAGTPVRFTTTGTLPTGLTAGTIYYVTFWSMAGSSLNPTNYFYVYTTTEDGFLTSVSGGSGTLTCLSNALVSASTPDTDTTNWTEVGPTNRFNAFDGVVSTKTERATSLQYVLTPGVSVNAVYVDGIVGGTITCRVLNASNAQQYTSTKALDGIAIGGGWQQYLFAQTDNIREAYFTGLPWASGYKIEITINANTGSAKVGEIVLGNVYSFGTSIFYGAEAGLKSYSSVSQNVFGRATRTRRAPAKVYSGQLRLTDAEVDKVARFLTDVESTPCAWIGVPGVFTGTLSVYGTYRSFKIQFKDSTQNYCILEIEGEV